MRPATDTGRRLGPSIALLAVLCAGPQLCSAAAVSGYGGGFPRLDPSARIAALCGTSTAVARGPESVFANPAGLVHASAAEFLFTYADLFGLGLVSHTVVGFDLPRPRREVVWEEGQIRQEALPPPAKRAWGLGFSGIRAEAGDETYQENQFAASYAQSFPSAFEAGLTVRWLRAESRLPGTGGSGWALDVGALRSFGPIRVGLISAALVSSLDWETDEDEDEENDPLPARFSLAAAWLPRSLPVSLTIQGDWATTDLTYRQAAAAAEWSPLDALVLRGGMRLREDAVGSRSDWSAGAGFRLAQLSVDYGLLHNARDLGDTHRWGASLHF